MLENKYESLCLFYLCSFRLIGYLKADKISEEIPIVSSFVINFVFKADLNQIKHFFFESPSFTEH